MGATVVRLGVKCQSIGSEVISRAQQPFQMQRGTLNTDLNLLPQWCFATNSKFMHPSRELDPRLSGLKFHLVDVLFFTLNKLDMFYFRKGNGQWWLQCLQATNICAVCGRLGLQPQK